MLPFTRWFKKSRDEDYEQVLSALANNIQKRQTKLSEIRLRERRSTLLTTAYTLSLWAAYVSMWYMNVIPYISRDQRETHIGKALAAAPVIIGPIAILFIRRIVQIWYNNIGDAEERVLKTLLKQQRAKVEEIKKKTNYYSTRNLIERYDDPSTSPLHRRTSPIQPQSPPPSTPQRLPRLPHADFQTPPVPGALKSHIPSSASASPSPQQFPTPRKQWYDKLADALLGDDDHEANAVSSRYALICEKCFAHNGLVKESMWEYTQYVCPKCGHFNPPKKSASPLPLLSPPASPLTGHQRPQHPSTTVTSAPDQSSDLNRSHATEQHNGSAMQDEGRKEEFKEGSSMQMEIDS